MSNSCFYDERDRQIICSGVQTLTIHPFIIHCMLQRAGLVCTFVSEYVHESACLCLCLGLDLKRLLPSMSPDPTELQRAIEVQLVRSAVGSITKTIQQPEQRTVANPE